MLKKMGLILLAMMMVSCASIDIIPVGRDSIASAEGIRNIQYGVVALVRQVETDDMVEPPDENSDSLGEEHEAYCAGSFIGPSTIITAAHCVSRRREVSVGPFVMSVELEESPVGDLKKIVPFSFYRNDQRMTSYVVATVTKFDRHVDLATLVLVQPVDFRRTVLHVADEAVLGEKAMAVGHPLGLPWTISVGVVSNPARLFDDNVLTVQSTAGIAPGNSGGVLVNSRGEILGVCSFTAGRYAHLGFFISYEMIRNFTRPAPQSHGPCDGQANCH